MGWLSIVTKVAPKLWNGGVKATSTLWKGGAAAAGVGVKAGTAVVKNPKTTATLAAGSYAGWKILSNPEQSAGTTVGKTIRESVTESGGFAHDVVNGITGTNTVEKVKDGASDAIDTIDTLKDTANQTNGILGTIGESLKGISNFFGNMFGGNGMNMFANFFNNLTKGNVSGWGIGALLAAGYMIFCRTGFLGKIGGAMLAMMMIGSNSKALTQTQTQTQSQAQTKTDIALQNGSLAQSPTQGEPQSPGQYQPIIRHR